MSVKLSSYVWDGCAACGVKGTKLLVMARLADFSSDEGMCFPAVKTIARQIGAGDSTVTTAIGDLEREGWLTRKPRRQGQRNASNIYTLNVAKLRQAATEVYSHKPVSERSESEGSEPDASESEHSESEPSESEHSENGEKRDSHPSESGGDPSVNSKHDPSVKNFSSERSDERPDAQLDDDFLSKHPEAVVFSAKKRQWGSQEDLTCAEWIWGKIIRLYEQAAETDGELAKPKDPNWTAWANEIRLMCALDGRTHRQICELFGRANRDPFWCRNVLSPAKLREKWDELTLRLFSPGGAAGCRKELDWDGTAWADKLYDEGILR